MNKIIEKISSYNLFNYLFPGVVYCIICDEYLTVSLIQESLATGIFLYYFVGLVISRIGSLILEPILKFLNVVKFSDYSDFVKAEKADHKIEMLSEINNMYRTVLSMILVLALTATYNKCLNNWPQIEVVGTYSASFGLFILFLFSYRKQTAYITKRISVNND